MIKNYFKIALRNIRKQKLYSLITISGLVLGLSVFTMFALVSEFTTHFDAFHENADRIFATVQVFPGGREGDRHSAITPAPLTPALLEEFSEIEKTSRFFPPGRMIVKYQDKIFYENRVRFVDSDFLSIFSFPLSTGNKNTALSTANSIVLTKETALKYFGNEDPLGKTLTLNNMLDVSVTGITKKIPSNSTISFDFLVSMDTARSLDAWSNNWDSYNHAAFLLLSEAADPASVEERLSYFLNKYYPNSPDSPKRLYLHPLLNFFMGSEGIDCLWGSGNVSYITLWIIAVLLLIIACINFMNISTARYVTRAHEVGMRKVVGAGRSQLIRQFLGESMFMALISFPLAVLLYEFIRPLFAAGLGDIFDVSLMDRPSVLILILGVTVLTGFFAGSYPAFYLSAFKPVSVFQKKLTKGKKGSLFRKTLVVVQFTFSVVLILITFISIKQTRYNLKVDLGFDRTNIMAVTLGDEARDKLEILKSEMVGNKDVISVSAAAALPIDWNPEKQVLPEGFGEDESIKMNTYGIDYGLIEMLNIKMISGRSFSRGYMDSDSFILNQKAVTQLQWDDPIGKELVLGKRKGTVIGVAEDFHFKPIFLERITPAVFYLDNEEMNYLLIKYSNPENFAQLVGFTENRWNSTVPALPFEYTTLENALFDSSQGDKTAQLTGLLGGLAILLSCLGLYGLSSYSVERRLKEIGIRKVLGASASGIVGMLTKDFIKLVILANLIAIPAAYFMMNAMMQFIYAYPTKIGAGIFIITALSTLIIAFLTVSSQTIKSALSNPIDSLKYE